MYIPEHLFSLGRLFSYYSVRKDKISLQLKRVHHTPLLRQNENFEYCQQDLKKYVYPLMTPLENLLRNNSSLFPFSPIPLHFSLCSVFPMSCMSPVISFGNHPEFANDKASPHRRPMRQNHTTEDELVIPWTMVLVGVPLMALKM